MFAMISNKLFLETLLFKMCFKMELLVQMPTNLSTGLSHDDSQSGYYYNVLALVDRKETVATNK